MRIRKIEKIKFEDAIEHFNFTQFYEICKIFGIDVVDREVYNQLAAEAREKGTSIDISKIKMRRDFDKMTEELIDYYNSLPRRNRRQIDPIVAKIVWGNKRANQIATDRITEQYNAAASQVDEVVEHIKENDNVELDNEIDVKEVIENETSTEVSSDMAAIASGSDN